MLLFALGVICGPKGPKDWHLHVAVSTPATCADWHCGRAASGAAFLLPQGFLTRTWQVPFCCRSFKPMCIILYECNSWMLMLKCTHTHTHMCPPTHPHAYILHIHNHTYLYPFHPISLKLEEVTSTDCVENFSPLKIRTQHAQRAAPSQSTVWRCTALQRHYAAPSKIRKWSLWLEKKSMAAVFFCTLEAGCRSVCKSKSTNTHVYLPKRLSTYGGTYSPAI